MIIYVVKTFNHKEKKFGVKHFKNLQKAKDWTDFAEKGLNNRTKIIRYESQGEAKRVKKELFETYIEVGYTVF